MILAGDIGGTHTRLGTFEVVRGRLRAVATQVYRSREHESLEALAEAFVSALGRRVQHACLGIAGPVQDGRCEAVNLAWVADARLLAARLGVPGLAIINDLEAMAYGVAVLGPADLVELAAGAPGARGNAAVIAAGTGLGEAGLLWDGRRHRPVATESGHADWAPVDELQLELLRFLLRELDHVSVERVLSGPGLHNIYRFLRDTGRGSEPAWLAEAIRAGDPPAVIGAAGLDRRAELAVRALDLLVAIYGAEAGNLGLRMLATGGVYVGGGIAAKLLPLLRAPAFLAAFQAKGRVRPLVETFPVRVILEDRAALLGAARYAALQAGLMPEAEEGAT
jgi:glucokinase